MNTFENFAAESLVESGFSSTPLSAVLGEASFGVARDGLFRYHTAREVSDDTHTVIYDINPYGVQASTPAMVVRRAAMAQVLGKGYALFGLEVSGPGTVPLTSPQRQLVAGGSFAPYSHRTLAAMVHIQRRFGSDAVEADKVLYGFSMGGDVAAETAGLIVSNRNAGFVALQSMGIFDPARTGRRSRTEMVRDFSTSGPNLFDEIVASNTLSLNQSRSIAGTQVSDRKKFELREGLHVAGQALRYPRESLAVMSGFGNDMTTRHLVTISRSNAIKCVVGRMSESTVCLDDLSTVLKREQSVAHMDPDTETLGSYDYAKRPTRMYEYNGYTHAAADNLLKSAGFMLQTVMR